jgi:hypothetical protein
MWDLGFGWDGLHILSTLIKKSGQTPVLLGLAIILTICPLLEARDFLWMEKNADVHS